MSTLSFQNIFSNAEESHVFSTTKCLHYSKPYIDFMSSDQQLNGIWIEYFNNCYEKHSISIECNLYSGIFVNTFFFFITLTSKYIWNDVFIPIWGKFVFCKWCPSIRRFQKGYRPETAPPNSTREHWLLHRVSSPRSTVYLGSQSSSPLSVRCGVSIQVQEQSNQPRYTA